MKTVLAMCKNEGFFKMADLFPFLSIKGAFIKPQKAEMKFKDKIFHVRISMTGAFILTLAKIDLL